MYSKEYMCVLRENSLNNIQIGEMQLRKASFWSHPGWIHLLVSLSTCIPWLTGQAVEVANVASYLKATLRVSMCNH